MLHIIQSKYNHKTVKYLFILAFFIGICSTNTESLGQNIKKPIRLEIISPTTSEKLEVAQRDIICTNFEEAISICNNLGKGWRIPTLSELELMHVELYEKKLGEFSDWENYLSLDRCSGTYCWSFKHKKSSCISTERIRVRVVRALN
jgi:hypothetical protein